MDGFGYVQERVEGRKTTANPHSAATAERSRRTVLTSTPYECRSTLAMALWSASAYWQCIDIVSTYWHLAMHEGE